MPSKTTKVSQPNTKSAASRRRYGERNGSPRLRERRSSSENPIPNERENRGQNRSSNASTRNQEATASHEVLMSPGWTRGVSPYPKLMRKTPISAKPRSASRAKNRSAGDVGVFGIRRFENRRDPTRYTASRQGVHFVLILARNLIAFPSLGEFVEEFFCVPDSD